MNIFDTCMGVELTNELMNVPRADKISISIIACVMSWPTIVIHIVLLDVAGVMPHWLYLLDLICIHNTIILWNTLQINKWLTLGLCTGAVLRIKRWSIMTKAASSPMENIASPVCKPNQYMVIWDLFTGGFWSTNQKWPKCSVMLINILFKRTMESLIWICYDSRFFYDINAVLSLHLIKLQTNDDFVEFFATHSDMGVFWMKANYGNHVMSLRRLEPITKILQIKYELNITHMLFYTTRHIGLETKSFVGILFTNYYHWNTKFAQNFPWWTECRNVLWYPFRGIASTTEPCVAQQFTWHSSMCVCVISLRFAIVWCLMSNRFHRINVCCNFWNSEIFSWNRK